MGNLGFDVKLRMVAHHFLRPQEAHMQVLVRDNNVDQALRILKKKLQREGIFREMRLREAFEKPSIKKAREKAEAIGRQRKLARKQMQREGLLPTKPRKGK
jgi:small subunit ribosomal protein S21